MEDYVLVVDDHPDVRMMIMDVLEMLGVPGRQATNGEEALRMAREQTPSLIVLDILMPVMNGLSLLTHINRHGRSKPVPVILLSGLDAEDRMRELPGVVAVLRKSDFTIPQLLSLLSQVVGGQTAPHSQSPPDYQADERLDYIDESE